MKNSGLKTSAKSGSPMQANYTSPAKTDKGGETVKNEKATEGKTSKGNTTWKGKLRAAKDALGERHFIQSYSRNKKDIRDGNYKDFPSTDKD